MGLRRLSLILSLLLSDRLPDSTGVRLACGGVEPIHCFFFTGRQAYRYDALQ